MSKQEDQDKLEEDIDALELHDKTEEEILRVIEGLSPEGMKLRKERKDVRYQLYRLKSEAEGKAPNASEEGFKEKFEGQEHFGGWRNFSVTWDVAMDDPYRIVHRIRSVGDEWDEIVKAKFPQINANGGIVYPDITVRKRVEAQAEEDKLAKKLNKKKPDDV